MPTTEHVSLKSRVSDVRELHEIREEVFTRLYERGHTVADLQAAAEAENVVEIQRLLGLTEREYERYARRTQVAAESLERRGPIEEPRPPPCPWTGCEQPGEPLITDGDCDYVGLTICTAASAGAAAFGTPAAWVIAVIGLQQCYCGNCWGGFTGHFCGARR